ncbi:uncharacterized protein [Rhodnius prolixus]|uniref:uncharacterized protein n=1 Tax=Rhodnius prolixus TaxID=13249 RepID=UPI003D18B477
MGSGNRFHCYINYLLSYNVVQFIPSDTVFNSMDHLILFVLILLIVAYPSKAIEAGPSEAETQEQGHNFLHYVQKPAQQTQTPQETKQSEETPKELVFYEEVPVKVPVLIPVKVPFPVKVPMPVPVTVNYPYIIHKKVEVPIKKAIPYLVEKPYPVKVIQKVPYEVPEPYPVKVQLHKIRHVYLELEHPSSKRSK